MANLNVGIVNIIWNTNQYEAGCGNMPRNFQMKKAVWTHVRGGYGILEVYKDNGEVYRLHAKTPDGLITEGEIKYALGSWRYDDYPLEKIIPTQLDMFLKELKHVSMLTGGMIFTLWTHFRRS